MPVSIGSNIASLQAQRRLGESSSALSSAFERLASGQRINRASDDSAGLAIAETLKTDRRVFGQAVRNVNDGISMLSIAEGAIDQMKGITIRQRELATQAANGTYSLVQRQALEKERRALEDEYNRVIRTTEFNGRNVFDESEGVLVLQAGYGTEGALRANADNTIDFGSLPMRVSTTSAGAEATGGASSNAQLSPDGRYVLFESSATNLVDGDTNGQTDIFRKDLITGETRRVNTDSSGAEATGGTSTNAQLSPEGRYVLFQSRATNLVGGDTNGRTDIFIKDLFTGETRCVSTDISTGDPGGGTITGGPQLSPDGRYVVFHSNGANLVSGDTNGSTDIFLKDLVTGETRRANTSSSGNQASGGTSSNAQVSPDSRYVVFQSDATNLVSGDTNGLFNIFLKDLVTGETRRANTSSSGAEATGGNSSSGKLSPDGRYVIFISSATNLVSGDTNSNGDIFIKDFITGETRRVNTDSAGAEATGGGSSAQVLSHDGRYMVFQSFATNLVSGDTNGAWDVFLKDLITGETRRINTNSSGGQATGGTSGVPQLSSDGRYVVFESAATNLVSGDTNAQTDIFLVANPLADRYSLALQFGVSLQTQSGAAYMQTVLDNQLNDLNSFQGQLGASQQRLGVAANVLGATNENIAAAESRIRDVDIAQESSDLTRTTILQQAASAVLAQANQAPALALTLLR